MENKQQTAVEWLINQVEDNMGDIPPEIKEQVKQMEKEQDIRINLVEIPQEQLEGERNPAYKYFDIDEQPSSQTNKCINCLEEKKLYSLCSDCIVEIGKSVVPEISDEEIEKRVKEVGAMGEYYKMGYRDAIIWYREQLKKK